MIKAILLVNNEVIISQTIPKTDDDNESFFMLMYPYLLTLHSKSQPNFTLTPWLDMIKGSVDEFIVYPDKIITMMEPRKDIAEYYRKLVLFNDEKIIVEDEVESEKIRDVLREEVDSVKISKMAEIPEDEIEEIYEEEVA